MPMPQQVYLGRLREAAANDADVTKHLKRYPVKKAARLLGSQLNPPPVAYGGQAKYADPLPHGSAQYLQR